MQENMNFSRGEALLCWAQTFPDVMAETTIQSFADIKKFNKILKGIDPTYFSDNGIDTKGYSAKLQTWQATWNKMNRYLTKVCGMNSVSIRSPDFIRLARKSYKPDVERFLEVALLIAVTSTSKERYVDKIETLSTEVRRELMVTIQAYMDDDGKLIDSTTEDLKADSEMAISRKNDLAKRLVDIETATNELYLEFREPSKIQGAVRNDMVHSPGPKRAMLLMNNQQELLDQIGTLEEKIESLETIIRVQEAALEMKLKTRSETETGNELRYEYSPIFDQRKVHIAPVYDPRRASAVYQKLESTRASKWQNKADRADKELDRLYESLCQRSTMLWEIRTGKTTGGTESWLSERRKSLLM